MQIIRKKDGTPRAARAASSTTCDGDIRRIVMQAIFI
jgi:hypothetical protein